MNTALSILGATVYLDEPIERSYDSGSLAVPREYAVLLGLTPRTVMETRTITVSTAGGFTALMSTPICHLGRRMFGRGMRLRSVSWRIWVAQ